MKIKEERTIAMALMLLLMVLALTSIMLMISSNTFLPISDLIMMMMRAFSANPFSKIVMAMDLVVSVILEISGLKAVSMMMTFLTKVLEVVLEVQAISSHFRAHLLEVQEVGYQSQPVQLRRQCNFILILSNGKSVTVKKTTITNPDGSKEVT
jgi:hypothetical protein